jgi:hypothetical protein
MRTVALFLLLSASPLFGADDPIIGTWKLNADKSKLVHKEMAGATMKVEPAGENSFKYTFTDSAGRSRSEVRIFDGKEHDAGQGTTVVRMRTDARHHTNTTKRNGTVVQELEAEISPDGKTLTARVKEKRGNNPIEEIRVYDRVN